MAEIADILRDGQDVDMPGLRQWLTDLQQSQLGGFDDLQALLDSTILSAATLTGYYPDARSHVPRGLTGVTVTNAGTGAANGTDIACTFAGGNFAVNPTVLFDRVGGAVTNVRVTGPGLYIGASPTAPTITFPGAGAGFAFTALTDFVVGSGETWWTDHATDTSLAVLYQNVSGTATAVAGRTFLKSFTQMLVPCTLGGSGNTWNFAPKAGFLISGTDQVLFGTAIARNTTTVQANCPGINGGANAPVKLLTGEAMQTDMTSANRLVGIRWRPSASEWELVWPAPLPLAELVQCDVVGGTANHPIIKVRSAGHRYRQDFSGCYFEWVATSDAGVGSKALTIQNADGTVLLSGNSLYDMDWTAQIPEGGWRKDDTLRSERRADGKMRRMKVTDPATELVAGLVSAADFDIPWKSAPVQVFKTERFGWRGSAANVVTDNPADFRWQNRMDIMVQDIAPGMSLGILKQSYAPALIAIRAVIGGRTLDLANLSTDLLSSGAGDGKEPSAFETVDKIGLMSDTNLNAEFGANDPKHNFVGLWHGLIQTDSASLVETGKGDSSNHIADGIGMRLRGTTVGWDVTYDAFRPSLLTPSHIGQTRYQTTLRGDGLHFKVTRKHGRALGYDTGSIQPAEGATITGAISGATAVVVVVPNLNATGSWGGGNRAGTMFVRTVVGTFQAGEDLKVGGTTYCKATGAAGPQISNQNGYACMLPSTGRRFAKVPNWPEFPIGLENDQYGPIGMSFYGGSSEVFVGDIIVGQTSGATGIVTHVPSTGATGTWGAGTRAGVIWLKPIVGQSDVGMFQATESLRVGGVHKASQGINVRPNLTEASRVQLWDPAEDVNGKNIILEMILLDNGVEASCPVSPPGDFSEVVNPRIAVQNRSGEAVDKVYVGSRSSGPVPHLWEGTYVSEWLIRVRIGAPV